MGNYQYTISTHKRYENQDNSVKTNTETYTRFSDFKTNPSTHVESFECTNTSEKPLNGTMVTENNTYHSGKLTFDGSLCQIITDNTFNNFDDFDECNRIFKHLRQTLCTNKKE